MTSYDSITGWSSPLLFIRVKNDNIQNVEKRFIHVCYMPCKLTCHFGLLLIIFVNICLFNRYELTVQVSDLLFHVECMVFRREKFYSKRINMNIKCKGQTDTSVWLICTYFTFI